MSGVSAQADAPGSKRQVHGRLGQPDGRAPYRAARWLAVLFALVGGFAAQARADDDAPPRDDFETDADGDGVPDGWYNLRDCQWATLAGGKGHCLRFEIDQPGRPARASRAFGVDGSKTEALIVGLWVRQENLRAGERLSDEAGLLLDFLGDEIRTLSRVWMGPWTARSIGQGWVHLARTIPVPPGTHDAILTLGLLGATGILEVDNLTIDAVPIGGQATTNLVRNGDAELGEPAPTAWTLEGGARRATPGHRSASCIDLSRGGSRASIALAKRPDPARSVEIQLAAKTSGIRAAATGTVFFVDEDGEPLAAYRGGVPVFRLGGSSDWRAERAVVPIPAEAATVVVQFDKPDSTGTLRIDDLRVTASPAGEAARWTPDHVVTDTSGWLAYEPAAAIAAGSALDFSFLLKSPIGTEGRISARGGRLTTAGDNKRARLLGVVLLPTLAVGDGEQAEALADRLARSGVNLVRIGELDAPYGPARSLIDDARDDTQALEPDALARFDHLIALLKDRGIHVALEFQSLRRFREGDQIAEARDLPAGGGAAAAFDPKIRARAVAFMKSILDHENPETGLPLRDDPVLAWVTLAGELSVFDQNDDPNALPGPYTEAFRALLRKEKAAGKKAWQAIESAQWQAEAQALHAAGLKAPIAGVSHWRREPEFGGAQAATGLDLIDDRIFWRPPSWGDPDRRSLVRERTGLLPEATKKRKTDRPYVVGQFAEHTRGAWALPFEGADFLYATVQARHEDWDALVRRGVFGHPALWGAAAPGTSGGDDLVRAPEILNANPQVFALLPHAASLMLRPEATERKPAATGRANAPRPEARNGVLEIDTPWTQGVAGWPGRMPHALADLVVEAKREFAVIVASSAGPEPLAKTDRVLVTAVGRCEPAGLRWADERREEVADPGRPPILVEPARGHLIWKRKGGKVQGYVLGNNGERIGPARVEVDPDGVRLEFDGKTATQHWELVVEE